VFAQRFLKLTPADEEIGRESAAPSDRAIETCKMAGYV
jgi:hypothetical protein